MSKIILLIFLKLKFFSQCIIGSKTLQMIRIQVLVINSPIRNEMMIRRISSFL